MMRPTLFSAGQKVTDRQGSEGTVVAMSLLGHTPPTSIYIVSFPSGAACRYGYELTADPSSWNDLNGIREFILDWLPSSASGDEFKASLIHKVDILLAQQSASQYHIVSVGAIQ